MATTIAPVTHNAFIKALKAVAPPELLETIVPDPEFTNAPASAAAADATASDLKYPCATQRAPGVADLVVGWGQTIPRWRKGQVVNFATLTYRLAEAAAEWNAHDVGVTFKWVEKIDDAAFVLQYGGDLGGVLASAYPPNDAPLNSVFVYQRAFQPDYKGVMKNVFLHELGHVLGLRHEFALEKETQLPAAQWGTKNPLPSDVIDAKAFYNLAAGQINGLLIRDWDPDN